MELDGSWVVVLLMNIRPATCKYHDLEDGWVGVPSIESLARNIVHTEYKEVHKHKHNILQFSNPSICACNQSPHLTLPACLSISETQLSRFSFPWNGIRYEYPRLPSVLFVNQSEFPSLLRMYVLYCTVLYCYRIILHSR